ncbi:MAG TPA: alpha-galactosidase, partial [Dehalococcoidia bacterium]|nr:alpha-galactosidase [Dehalococcoidia bacterium]
DGDGFLYLIHWGADGGAVDAGAYLPQLPLGAGQAGSLGGRPLAYPVYGDPVYKEPCLVVARGEGARDVRLTFVADRIEEVGGRPQLELEFFDPLARLRLFHCFRVFAEHDLIARSVAALNDGAAPLTLERLLSAALPLPPDAYELWSLHGQWAGEFQLQRRPLGPGTLALGSRRGTSSAQAHPWFAVGLRSRTTEQSGPVWFGSLAWSGNWAAFFEIEPNDALAIAAGLQPFDFAWRLAPGERFETPVLLCGYSDEGLDGAARLLHGYEAKVALAPDSAYELRPVLYNSWEATQFDVRVDDQIELARRAAALGVELFVVDDGWFGARDSDRAGLGDWAVNPRKFPHGLRPLIDGVHRVGMGFGLWVEPEMVNPDSDLYRAHPDWAYHVPGRQPTLGRNQLVLNFAREDVREHIFRQLSTLLSEHGRIEFLKWDHNRDWSEVGWPEQPERAREVWVRHVRGVYEVLGRLRAAFPYLRIESCASGGGRADLGMVGLTDQVWTSDNTDAADRLLIQYGYSRAHSPRTMVDWVTDVPNQQTGRWAPLAFRFHVAMQGVLGIGGDIRHWSAAELAQVRAFIAQYKAIRPTIQQGRQYWLLSPAATGPCAVQYVSERGDEVVLFLYQVRGQRGKGPRRVRLRGLLAERRYRRESDGAVSTGAALMAAGVPADFGDDGAWQRDLDWRSELQVWRAAGR